MTLIKREHCQQMDQHDPLAPLREDFALPEQVIYLDGNSLGARPKAALSRAQHVLQQEWGDDLIKSWNSAGWYQLPTRLGDQLASLIGAEAGEVVIADSTSINLFKALAAALRLQSSQPQRKVIVSERSNFPTDLYMAQGLNRWLERGYSLRLIDQAEDLASALGDDVAVVMLTHVNYRTGYMHEMQAVTQQVQQSGALMLWDLAHSAGAVPVDLNAAQADFAVGCTYKYLNGGPGAPAFIWVPKRHQASFEQPLSGWWSHATPFTMSPEFAPCDGIRRALVGTPGVVSLALVECGLASFQKTSMAALREKSLALTDLFINLLQQECAEFDLHIVTPLAHAQRGSQVSVVHEHAYALIQALITRGVIGDYREPGIMRFGFTPLYVRFVDVWDAVAQLRDLLATGNYQRNLEKLAVT